ncbi:Gamma-tubulin complex component 2 [Nosema granulosis]|uniref:Gamma-tubulin complex component 2 n=1 Tax=Nosema granulosis TaxID=83296 RepID=A0A9P6GVQ3_9MICR|nr:Gamma-tubulin complex component 2 [Nosema granulosis]
METTLKEKNKHTIILDNLFYALCGLDTTYLKIGINDKSYVLNVESEYPFELLQPFESLCINVRIVNKFILKSQYSTDAIKKILSDVLESILVQYMQKVSGSRSKIQAIESLYVLLETDIMMFEEIRGLIDSTRGLEGVMIYNNLEARRKKNVRFVEFYDLIIRSCTVHIEEEIVNWVTKGILPDSNFMIKKNNNDLEFEECYWTGSFIKNETQIPFYLKPQFDLILKCGKYVNFNRMLGNRFSNEDILRNEGLVGLSKYLEQSTILHIQRDLKNEFDIIGKYILMKDSSFYSDLLAEMDKKLLFWNKKSIFKINTFKKTPMIDFYTSPDTINGMILKIFNPAQASSTGVPIPIIQSLSIDFKPKILKFFIDRKSFRELELIFRFLFTLTSIQHFLQKDLKFRFSKIVVSFINTFRFTVLYETESLRISTDIDSFLYEMSIIIKQYLNNLFLTSSNIFEVFAELFDVCFEFIQIEYKDRLRNDEIEEFDKKIENIMKKLWNLCKNANCDYILVNCLENLTKEGVFKND